MRMLSVVLASITLSACISGLNSKLPERQSYRLGALIAPTDAAVPVTATDVPNAASSLEIMLPSAAPGLAREEIAVLRSGERLDFYTNARWAAPATAMLQTLLIDRLRDARRFANVESDAGPFAAKYVLSLELQHFEAVYDAAGAPNIEVALVCTLGRRADRSVVTSFTAHSEVRAEADRMQAVVAAFDQATAQVLTQIAADIVPPAP
jgi:ABC-type uncharacterized transport system auxiliary subunit